MLSVKLFYLFLFIIHSHQDRAETFKQYIQECQYDLDEHIIQVLYERMITECCLNRKFSYSVCSLNRMKAKFHLLQQLFG